MSAAEKHAVGDVRLAVISSPEVDVVGFAKRGGLPQFTNRHPPSRTARAMRCYW